MCLPLFSLDSYASFKTSPNEGPSQKQLLLAVVIQLYSSLILAPVGDSDNSTWKPVSDVHTGATSKPQG